MKARALMMMACIAGTTALTAGPQANAEQCDSPIYVFSTTRIQTDIDDPTTPAEDPIGRNAPSAVSSAVGCTVRDEVNPGPEFEYFYGTDLIYPGSNRLSVRLLNNGRDPSILSLATLTIGDDVVELEMKGGASATDPNAPWMDSQNILIDPSITLAPLTVTAKLCMDVNGTPEDISDDICFERVYNSVPSHPLPA